MNLAVRWMVAGSLAAVVAAAAVAQAQTTGYPNKPVRWVVPFPPGGSADIMGRMIGQDLAKALGQQVVIENKPGAGGMIGAAEVARATPDGTTLLMSTMPTLVLAPLSNPRADFRPLDRSLTTGT